MKAWATWGLATVTAASLLAAGCDCSLDASAIDDLPRCETPADCPSPYDRCVEGYCQRAETDAGAACGPDQTPVGSGCACTDQELAACGASCVRTNSDPAHCGGCDHACDEGQVCQGGECRERCDGGLTPCEGACVDLQHDRLFCGDCDTRCQGEQVCVQGSCGFCSSAAECDDGLDCTVDDCVDQACTNEIVPGQCIDGGTCVAAGLPCTADRVCAPCAGGCVVPPTSLVVDCNDLGAPDRPEVCNITTDRDTVAACLSCTVLAGMTELLREDFSSCPIDNRWTVDPIVDGPICPLEDPDVVFPGTGGSALEADGAGWTIERRVDTRDFDTVRLCFDYAARGADANSVFEVSVDTGAGYAVVFRDTAPVRGVGAGPAWVTECLTFGDLAVDTVGIRFHLDTADNKDLYLDNIFLDGWHEGDLARDEIFAQHFTGCVYPGWTLEGAEPTCPAGFFDDEDALEVLDSTFSVSLQPTGRAPCEDPWLLFGYGHYDTDGNETLTVDLALGAADWQLVWGNELGVGAEGSFTPLMLGLAHIDPGARGNADLGVRFDLSSDHDSRAVALDDVVLEGKSCEPAGDRATVEAPTRVGDSAFSFVLRADRQITLHPACTWGGDDTIAGTDRVTFLR